MSRFSVFVFAFVSAMSIAQAKVLSAKDANSICGDKALRAAHFIAESKKPFMVKFKASKVAEISTAITYEFTYQSAVDAGLSEPLYTVHAYAYPDDKSCLIGVISNNIAGND